MKFPYLTGEVGNIGIAKIKKQLIGANWWQAGDIAPSSVAAVWQPKGAASLAASYLRVAGNLGYANIDPAVVGVGVAPTWDAVSGWTFNGSTQFLLSGITTITGAGSVIARFSGARTTLPGGGDNFICGGVNIAGGIKRFYLVNYAKPAAVELGVEYGLGSSIDNNNGWFDVMPPISSGTLAIAGPRGYRNGVIDTGLSASNVGTTQNIAIGGIYLDGSLYATYPFLGSLQAIAFYIDTKTAPQIAAVHAAMMVL